jgi:peptide/nickel transport system substrate-binding protein
VVPLRDPNALALRLLHGDGDLAELKPDIVPLFEGRRDFVVRSSASAGFTYLGTRCDRGPLAQPQVRRAIALAVDRDGLRRARLGRYAVPATGPLPPTHWAYEGEVPRYDFNPARARAMLDAAGLIPDASGVRARLVLRVSTQRFALLVAQALAAMLGDVGIAVEVRPSELGTLLADLRAGRFDLTLLTVPDLTDPWGLSFWFSSSAIPSTENPNAGGNRWRFRDASLDRALAAGAASTDPALRAPHYRAAQRILAAQLPVIPLWHADVVTATRRALVAHAPRGDGRLDHLLDVRPRLSDE